MPIVYLNGEYLPQEEAKVSVMDRGFLFGDGVYEIIPIYDGHMVGLKEHLQRLKRSLTAIHMTPPMTDEEWINVFNQLLERNNKTSGTHNIYLQITRGPGETRSHALPETYQPTVIAFCVPPRARPRKELNKGFSAITLDDSRRRDCSVKAITLLPNILLYEEARKVGAAEAILIRNGEAVEGTSSNLFVVMNNVLLTPPLSSNILAGITRQLILKLAKEKNIPCRETTITKDMLHDASEIWLTGSSKEIFPITKLDDKPVGEGKVGPIWERMMDYYEAYKTALQQTTK